MYPLTRLCLQHPKAAGAVLLAVTLVLAAGLPRVRPEFGYRVLIGDQHPAVQRLDDFIERFGGGLPIQIGWECGADLPCQNVFDADSLTMAQDLTDALRPASGVSTVLGPSNAPLLVAGPGGFQVRRLVEHGVLASDADRLARLAIDDPLWREVLVAPDATAAILVVQPTDSSAATSQRVSDAVEAALVPHRARGHRFYLTGDPIQNGIVGRDLAESTARLIPFTVLVIVAILYGLSRSLRATAVALATLGAALAWTFGLLGWIGWPQDGVLEVLAPLILVVGVCDSVHLLSKHADLVARADAPGAASDPGLLLEASRQVAGPCVITTLTTAAAFLSFTTSDLATFHRFGSVAAFGTLACLLLTFSLLPLLVRWLPDHQTRSVPTTRGWIVAIESILDTSQRRAVPILWTSGLILVFCAAGWWLHLRVDHEWTESLGESSEVVQSWRFMEDRIGRSDTLEVEVALPDDALLDSPDTLRRLRALSSHLGTLENLRSPRSVVDVVERVNQLLHDDDPAHRTIPGSSGANAEILELVGFDDPGLLAQWVSFDRTRVRISVGAPEQAFSTREKVLGGVDRFARERLPPSWQLLPTGRVAMQHSWIQDVQATQLRSFPTALVLVFGLVAVFLRSIRLAAAALVPTVLPIVLTLGAMGWSGMTLDVGRAMIAAILLGIGVDDSVHILDQYRRRRATGDAPREAIRGAVLQAGRAVVTTSLALALGFLTLMASAWQSIASFGFLSAVAILGALAASLFVLPALVFAFAQNSAGAGQGSRPKPGASRKRRVAAIAIALPVAVSLAWASALAIRDDRPWAAPCWLLPKGHVVALPGSGRCPLQLLDEITQVGDAAGRVTVVADASEIRDALATAGPVARIELRRQGRLQSIDLPLEPNTGRLRIGQLVWAVVVTCGLLGLPLRMLLRSSSAAALPLAIFLSSAAAVLVPLLGGQQSPMIDALALFAFVLAPAALAQLAMTFPHPSRMIRMESRLQAIPYAASALLGCIGLLALNRSPLLWPTFIYLLLALHVGGWGILFAACAFAPREADMRADLRATGERSATTARVATGLMHELGKDLGWMRGLARRLARQAERDPKLRHAASEVGALAQDLTRRIRFFVEDATSQCHDPPNITRLDELVESCVRDLTERYGPGRIRTSHDPSLRGVRCPENLRDALVQALDGAVTGEPHSEPLLLRVRLYDERVLRLALVGDDGGTATEICIPIGAPGAST